MSKQLGWLTALGVLVMIALLVACGSSYSASSDGLLIVPSLGSDVVQSFSFNLTSGHVSQINSNPTIPGPPDQGARTSIVLDPTGKFAYVTTNRLTNPGTDSCSNSSGIATYKVNSNGTLSAVGTQTLNGFSVAGIAKPVPVQPVALAVDNAGKLLFVADSSHCALDSTSTAVPVPGTVSVFSIGANAALTEVAGSPFAIPLASGEATPPNPLALAVTHTGFPGPPAACANNTAQSSEFLYVADEAGNDVVAYSVASSGALQPLPVSNYTVGTEPSGVAVDPCNRFVYVTNFGSNNISAFNICTKIGLFGCTAADNSLVIATGSPFSAGTGPGPLAIDPYGDFLYAVNNAAANQISAYKIAQVTGALTALSPAVYATGGQPVSIAIRSDAAWLFVTNYQAGTVSQFGITPATGNLTPGVAIQTDNYPWGVAVK